jgi:hypothetical protein
MLLRTRTSCSFLLVIALLISAGCGGGGGESGPKTANVSGVIYLDGKPLPDALVTFSTKEFAGSGRTNSEGRYELAQGAVPGENKVVVSKWEGGEGLELNPEEGMDEGQFEAMADPGGTGKNVNAGPKQLIPEHYSNVETTDLTYNVPEGGSESADFRLQSK